MKKIKVIFLCLLFETLGCKTFVTPASNELYINSIGSTSDTSINFSAAPGFTYSKVTVDMGSSFLASNITVGQTIFGITGTAPIPNTNSNGNRTVLTPEITQIQEVTTYAGSSGVSLPTGYRDVPDLNLDDEGGYLTGYCGPNSSVPDSAACLALPGIFQWIGNSMCIDIVNNTSANCLTATETWVSNGSPCLNVLGATDTCTASYAISSTNHAAYVDCGGQGFTSIAAAVADCADPAKNGLLATWNGQLLGTHGEANWSMVAHRTAPTVGEVWQDQRTGLLWSTSAGAAALNQWCMASGNQNMIDVTADCSANTFSYCSEVAGLNAGFAGEIGEVWGTPPLTYDNAKGGLGATSSVSVSWKLPSKYDYMQADIDGIRNVMPDMGGFATAGTINEWTSTVLSTNRANAWIFGDDVGTVASAVETTPYLIRCVGR